jgi:cold shock CspA family protein
MPTGTQKWFAARTGDGSLQATDHTKDIFARTPALRDGAKVFGTLTMPNGQRIKTMREDAFRAALAASGQRGSR